MTEEGRRRGLRIPGVQEENIDTIITKNMKRPTGYQIIVPIYTKENEEAASIGGLVKRTKWKLFLAKVNPVGDSDLILDMNGYVNPKLTDVTVVSESEFSEVDRLCSELTPKSRHAIEKVLFERIERPQEYGPANLPPLLFNSGILKRPVPKITDIRILNQIDWVEFTESLVEYKCRKDENVKLFLKKDLLRGINPPLNPNSIIAKNPGAGMTSSYQQIGIHIGKATKNSTVGFAKSPTEIYPGVVHEQDLTIAMDQIESQTEGGDIFGYLFDITEQGITYVSAGAIRFPVTSSSKLAFIANIQPREDPTKSFRFLLDQISVNSPAYLKRVGVILFDDTIEPVKDKETSDFSGWRKRAQFFRAVEEVGYPTLRRFHFKDAWRWSQQPLGDYGHQFKEIIRGMSDIKVRLSFKEHAEGAMPRVRGAGLEVALAEELSEIALNHTLDLKQDILAPAEEYAHQFAEMNLASISRIADTWDRQKENLARSVYENVLPNYMKEIVSAVEQFRKVWRMSGQQMPEEVPMQMLGKDYQCQFHQYFSRAITQARLAKRGVERYNQYLMRYYNFKLVRKELGEIHVRIY